jgi:hypothetical protein
MNTTSEHQQWKNERLVSDLNNLGRDTKKFIENDLSAPIDKSDRQDSTIFSSGI